MCVNTGSYLEKYAWIRTYMSTRTYTRIQAFPQTYTSTCTYMHTYITATLDSVEPMGAAARPLLGAATPRRMAGGMKLGVAATSGVPSIICVAATDAGV